MCLAACGNGARVDAGDVASADSVPVDGSAADAGGDALAADGGAGITIPDPGNGVAEWIVPGTSPAMMAADMSTPDTAFPVGVVRSSPGYLQAWSGPNGDAFFVFRTGPMFTDFRVAGVHGVPTGDPDFIHVHDGAGLVFGPEIMPVTSTPSSGRWTLEADHVYVLEIHFPGGTFF